MKLPILPVTLFMLAASALVVQADTETAGADSVIVPPATPAAVLAISGPDTLRTNLQVVEALMGEAVQAILPDLPPTPTAVVLVPGSTEQAATIMTNVATHHLAAAGYAVHLDQAPVDTAMPVVEFRFRVENLALAYPDSGRRLLFWKSWVGRQMDLALQVVVADTDGQVLISRRQVHGYQDRVPVEYVDTIESPTYAFTRADAAESGSSRRLEQVVVLGTLAGLVAVYFANTE